MWERRVQADVMVVVTVGGGGGGGGTGGTVRAAGGGGDLGRSPHRLHTSCLEKSQTGLVGWLNAMLLLNVSYSNLPFLSRDTFIHI